MQKAIKILHLEDVHTDAELIYRQLQKAKLLFELILVDNKEDYLKALTDFSPEIILSDHSLPLFNSQLALEILQELNLRIPFILVTATVSEEFAVDIIKNGAADYIFKDRLQRLPSAILNAVEKYRLETEHQLFLQKLVSNEILMNDAQMLAHFGSFEINAVIFGLYKKFDSSGDGKGMGLCLAKTLVDNLGGTIKAHSELHIGTTFSVELPLL